MSENREVDSMLSQSQRDNNGTTNGRRLVLNPTTGKLEVQTAAQAQQNSEGIPLQKVGGWALKGCEFKS